MAVDAHHLLLNNQIMTMTDGNLYDGYPLTTADINLLPINTDSLPLSRKRARDSFSNAQNHTFLGQDISFQIQQQQLEIDQFIALHTERVRMDIEEKRNRNSRRIITAVEEGIWKRLRAKEEEIVRIAKLNWALEEKVKSLCAENQIWRQVAQTNEATANALRSNLEQVVQEDFRQRSMAACEEDAQSCCESNSELEEEYCRNKRWCKKCGKEESSVLLLPCRHLCLCTLCASSVDICPVCKTTNNISLHVHFS